jgi:hypothetical protein
MYKEKIDTMLEKLNKQKDITIHSSYIFPPLSNDELTVLKKEFSIPKILFDFYKEMNGFQVSYTSKSNKDFKKEAFGYYDNAFPKMWPNENYWHLDGCINLLPIDFIYRNNWKDYIWFDDPKGKNANIDFEKKILPLDVFSKSSIAAMMAVDNEVKVYLSSDHNASYLDYPPISLEAYLDGIIHTKGLVEKRPDIFNK